MPLADVTAPATRALAIVPTDSADLAEAVRLIALAADGEAGDVYFVLADDPDEAVMSARIDHGMPVGPYFIRRVTEATTATGLIGYV